MTYIEGLRDKISNIIYVKILTEKMIWERHDAIIWKSEKFEGSPSFYPVYRWKDYYSFSILALILKKNYFKMNIEAVDNSKNNELSILSSYSTIDRDIVRIGQPHKYEFSITNVYEYSKKIAEALKKDIMHIETLNPGFTNIIMCGGKDSLNLLLLPWKNPVVAISAEPNYNFVREFIENNNLDIKLEKLEDKYDESGLEDEILEACCRVDLSHWRWGIHIKELVKKYSKRVIIWKGQLGDVYMSPTWKTYIYPQKEPQLILFKIYKKISKYLPIYINKKIGHIIQPLVIKTTWNKSASLQGSHVGFIRALSDCLVLSAYHGSNVMSVFSQADLGVVAQNDIRPTVGELLHGKKVKYPKFNPGPEVSKFRKNLHKTELFVSALDKVGVSRSVK